MAGTERPVDWFPRQMVHAKGFSTPAGDLPEDDAVRPLRHLEFYANWLSICAKLVPAVWPSSIQPRFPGLPVVWMASATMRVNMAGARYFSARPLSAVPRSLSSRCTRCGTGRMSGDNMGAQFNITAIAEHAGVSKRTLETRFRTHLECSPHDFLTRLRIQCAATLMGQADPRTIERIAAESGFGAVSTFHAAFQRITGHSPALFREKFQAAASEDAPKPARGSGNG